MEHIYIRILHLKSLAVCIYHFYLIELFLESREYPGSQLMLKKFSEFQDCHFVL